MKLKKEKICNICGSNQFRIEIDDIDNTKYESLFCKDCFVFHSSELLPDPTLLDM